MLEVTELLKDVLREELEAMPSPVERRVAANALRRLLDELDPPLAQVRMVVPEPLREMTDAEAKEYGAKKMLFGMHTGTEHRDVPYEYFAWLCDERRKEWREMLRYLKYLEARDGSAAV